MNHMLNLVFIQIFVDNIEGRVCHVLEVFHLSEHIIEATEVAFDDFADGGTDEAGTRKMLGID